MHDRARALKSSIWRRVMRRDRRPGFAGVFALARFGLFGLVLRIVVGHVQPWGRTTTQQRPRATACSAAFFLFYSLSKNLRLSAR